MPHVHPKGGRGTNIEEIKQLRDAGLCFDHSGGGGIVSNDFFCSAVTLGEWTWGFCTLYASTDGPPGSCATPENDIWYFYDAPCDGTVSVETCSRKLAGFSAG
jgi:hypothetical protein